MAVMARTTDWSASRASTTKALKIEVKRNALFAGGESAYIFLVLHNMD
jgi:hypothetical protein